MNQRPFHPFSAVVVLRGPNVCGESLTCAEGIQRAKTYRVRLGNCARSFQCLG